MGRTVRSVKNFISLISLSFMMTSISIFITPFVLKGLGSEKFGVFRLTLDWLGYLALLDFGLNESMVPVLALNLGRDDVEATEAALVAGVRALILTIIPKLFFGLGFVFLINIFIPIQKENLSDLRMACLIGVASSFFCIVMPFRSLFEVRQLGYQINSVLIVKSAMVSLFSLIFAWAHYGVFGQALALFIGECFFGFFVSHKIFIKYPGLLRKIIFGKTDRLVWKNLWRLNHSNFISNVCSRVSNMSDNIIISVFMRTEMVTPFFMTQKLVSFLSLQLYSVSSSTWAALIELHSKGEVERFQLRFLEVNQLVVTIGLITMGPVIAFNSHFIRLWLGSEFYAGDWIAFFGGINATFLALIAYWSWIFTAKGISPLLLPQYIVFSGVNLIFSILSTKFLGVVGPLVGTSCAIFGVTFWVTPALLRKHFNILPGAIYRGIYRPFLILIVPFLLIWVLARGNRPLGWLALLFEMALSGLFLSSVAWFFILSTHERETWIHRLKMKLGTS